MKLKFRADAKDVAVFLAFCLVLLYVVAVIIVNLVGFASANLDHPFAFTVDPMKAFTAEYIAPTFVFFILALIMIMTSVSSYFFERDKGFGFSTEKKDKGGYSRWAKDREMKKQLKPVYPDDEKVNSAGVALINNGREMWVDDSEYHNLVIGSTGSGKTQIVVLPLVKILAKHGESMIITDPKGEIYKSNGVMLREKGYNVIVLNFRDPDLGSAWNPLMLPYQLYKEGNRDKAIELLDDLAINILYDEKAQNQDPFWEKTSADYFVGLALALFEDAKEEEVNLNSINLMSTIGEEKYRGNSNYLKEYFSDKDPSSPMYINVASALLAPSDTKSSILSVFKQKIKLFSSREKISEMLSHSDFDMKSIGRTKTAVFIVVQDEKKTYHPLVTNFIKQCYETLIDVAQENGGKLNYRTNFILDEFANMPPLKDVTTMVTAARSRLIRFTLIIQNFAQLYQVYGKENGETIKGNCGNIIYLISSELSALEEISKMAGEVKSKEKDKTASTPLITVSDLQRLKKWETIILRTRMMPFKVKLTPDYQMNWGRKYPEANFVNRPTSKVIVFDLKKFVDEKNRSKMNDVMGGFNREPSSFNPPIFGERPLPFGERPIEPSTPSSFDVDDLVKRIDAKIAELEEEERKEKEAASIMKPKVEESKPEFKVPSERKPFFTLPDDYSDENDEAPIPEVKQQVVETPVYEEPKEEVAIVASPRVEEKLPEVKQQPVKPAPRFIVTDDQFFDDFFNDDEE